MYICIYTNNIDKQFFIYEKVVNFSICDDMKLLILSKLSQKKIIVYNTTHI